MERDIVLKTKAQQLLEARLGRSLEVELRWRYHELGQTQREIAAALGIESSTVSRYMAQLGIEARNMGPRPSEAVA